MARRLALTIGVLLFILTANAVLAADCVSYEAYFHWIGAAGTGFAAGESEVRGDITYVLDAEFDLVVMRTGDPANMKTIGRLPMGGISEDIALYGHYAIICCRDSSVVVVDIADSTAPVIRASTRLPGPAEAMVLEGDLAYVTCDPYGLAVVDLQVPLAPQVIGQLPLPDGCGDIKLIDHYACIAARRAGLLVVDVAAPNAPVWVGRWGESEDCHALDAAGGLAYVAVGESLVVCDLVDPTAPRELGLLALTGWPYSVAVTGSIVCVGVQTQALELIDVENPSSPVRTGRLVPWAVPVRLTIDGTRIYASCSIGGLHLFDLANARTPPVPVGHDVAEGGSGIVLRGHRLYLATNRGAGLSVIDITQPDSPQLLGMVTDVGRLQAIVVEGDFVYAAAGGAGLKVIDISDPGSPHLVGNVDTPGSALDVVVEGDRAFVADEDSGVQIVDVADPSHPVISASVDTPGSAMGIRFARDHVFVADGDDGLVVIDVSDPNSPRIVGGLNSSRRTVDLAVQGDLAYLVEPRTGVRVVDVSDPTSLHTVGGGRSPDFAGSIELAGSCAYVLCGPGIQVLDLANPRTPRSIGSLPFGGQDMAVAEDRIFAVADMARSSGQLRSMLVQCGGAQSPAVVRLAASPEGGAVRVTWEVVNPGDAIGFVVRRAQGRDPSQESYVDRNREHPVPTSGPWEFLDREIDPDEEYSYKIEMLLPAGDHEEFGPCQVTTSPAPALHLFPPRPNPVRGTAGIRFELPRGAATRLEVVDVRGRRVRRLVDRTLAWGPHDEQWDGLDEAGRPAPSGAYFLRLMWEGRRESQRLILLR